MQRQFIVPGKTVRKVITVKTIKKPQPGRVVSAVPQNLPSRPTNGKVPGVKRIYYG